jgi:hypothetical protein
LNVLAIVVVTGICFVGGGIVALSIATIRNIVRHRCLAKPFEKRDN